jgi:AraC-like DNA-binding protein
MKSSLDDLYFPVQYLEIGAAMIKAGGGDEAAFYRRFELGPADLAVPGKRVSARLIQQALADFMDGCPPGLAPSLQFMRHFPITAHGPLGMLMLTNRNFGEALDAGLQYYPLLIPVFNMRRQDIGDRVHIIVEDIYDLGRTREFLLEMTLLMLFKLTPFLARRPAPIQVYFAHAAPGHAQAYGDAFDGIFQFGASQNKLVIAREDLGIPLLAYSPTSAEQFRHLLEQQSRDSEDNRPTSRSTKRLLRRAVEQRKALDAEQLAGLLHLSTRTLSRRLRDEGTTLPALEVTVRVEYAQVLLLDSRKTIADIAQQVGFGDSASFSRAFKRIIGKTPREYRG